MRRYQTELEDGTLYIEHDDGRLEVGEMDDIVALVGGETYTLEYDERQRTVAWLDTEDGELTFEVREVLADMSYTEDVLTSLAGADLDSTDEEGYPLRTSVFADLMTRIWDSKGNVDLE
jgi:YD repeat-containing protein